MKYICPICGYSELDEAPLNYIKDGFRYYSYVNGAPTYEICPCCGTEFGYGDYEKSWEELRKIWIKKGMKWHSKYKNTPKNWDPKKQLKNLKKIPKKDYKAEELRTKK